MLSAIHSLKSPPKQRSKSQTVTQRTEQAMLKTFIQKRTIPNDQILKKTNFTNLHTNPHRSTNMPNFPTTTTNSNLNINMNMLLNGKSLQQVTSNTKYRTLEGSPKVQHAPNIREYIYKKYLTQHQEQMNPHAQGIIRLRQMFNQRLNRTKINENKEIQGFNQTRWPKLQIYKVTTSITEPDLNNVNYMGRAKKYDQSQPSRDRYYRIFRHRQQEKKQSLTPHTVQERSLGLEIEPWDTD